MDLALLVLLFSWSIPARAFSPHNFTQGDLVDQASDCLVQVGNLKFDLTPIGSEEHITRERTTPPTREVDSVRVSLCSDLKPEEGEIPANDQCPTGTRVCLTKTNIKESEPDSKRIVSVIPLASTAALDPSYIALSSPKGISVLLHGGAYPHPINGTDTQQSVNITVLCDTEQSPPKFVSYDGAQLWLEWTAPAGCGFEGDNENHDKEGESPGNEQSGSGSLSSVGWFLLLLLLAFATYMGLGAYYNYSTYGASGVDLIPHRDFWMEVPYMLRDVLSHLCSNVRPRRSSSRGGYIAV
ncbi:autophagy-related protein 27 [Mycena crocata]|nr:autophagy-related protein 27 [Mycena crocata]